MGQPMGKFVRVYCELVCVSVWVGVFCLFVLTYGSFTCMWMCVCSWMNTHPSTQYLHTHTHMYIPHVHTYIHARVPVPVPPGSLL